ncbi:MAG: heat-inducible transcription repressor HrcA [Anaerolinea sp. 4484_236]|nr:MAG: heat-inducible transcription repressor HrcA [Anaerolinea sp. 4484_236]
MMKTLTERQKTILMLVVREYIDSGQPVGSKSLVKNYKLDVSSATVRNEMRALTEMGYLRTTSGRIPTGEGYRYFVGQIMHQTNLPETVQRTISHQFSQAHPDIDQWMTLAASVLAHQSQAVSLITAPHNEQVLFKHVELISTQGRQVLMVLVLVGGEVSQQILTLAEPVPQERLSQAAERLNQSLQGLNAASVVALSPRPDALEQDILLLIQQDMQQTSERSSGEIYMDGLANVLAEPTFADSDEGRRTLRLFDERARLQSLIANTVVDSSIGGVQVLIGGDESWEELRQCSMVLARYGIPDQSTGLLGVLGPMRMSYARTIPTVRFMADLLSGLIIETFSGE